MENCLHCGEPLTHVPGRKEKSFCNTNCRNKYFYAKNKRLLEAVKGNMDSALSKPLNLRQKVKGEPDIAPQVPKDSQNVVSKSVPAKPRNLDELKALCPYPEKSDERSEWVRTERQKYGI